MTSSLLDRLDSADNRNRAYEDQRTEDQRRWEERLEERHQQAQMNMVQELNRNTSRLMDGLFQVIGQNNRQQPQHQARHSQQYQHPGAMQLTYASYSSQDDDKQYHQM